MYSIRKRPQNTVRNLNVKKIKILQVGIDSHLGGIETYLLEVARHIDGDAFQLDFLSYYGETPCFFKELVDLGCGFKFIHSRRRSPVGNICDLRKLYEEEKYDIVQCNVNSLSYVTPAIEAVNKGISVLLLSHNAGASSGSSSKLLNCINKIRFPFDRVKLAAVSDNAGKWMFGNDRSFVVLNNGVDTCKYRFSLDDRLEVRKELGVSSESEILLHVGAFRSQKNHRFIVKVFHEYLKKNPNALLVLVGDGELKPEIIGDVENLGIKENVLFLGIRNDVNRILSASDKFFFPSLYEGFPISLIEAETNGVLCVVSDAITNEVCFDNCVRLSLEDSIDTWTTALERHFVGHRKEAFRVIEEVGLGIDSTIGKLEQLYRGMVRDGR